MYIAMRLRPCFDGQITNVLIFPDDNPTVSASALHETMFNQGHHFRSYWHSIIMLSLEVKMNVSRSVVAAAVVAMSGALSPHVFSADVPAKGGDFISIKASELKWVDAPSLGPKAKVAVLEGDLKAAEPFTMRAKLPPKLTIGVHTHPTTERVTVLSGVLYFSLGDKIDVAKATAYKPGDAFMVPAGASMYAFTKNKETIIQIHGTGPWGIDYHTPADEPKTKQ